MHQNKDIPAELTRIMVELFELDPEQVVPSARLYEDLDLDSIDAVDLVVRLQELTGRKIDIEQYKTIRTMQDLIDVVTKIAQEEQ